MIVFKHKHNHWVYSLVCRPSQLIQHLQEKMRIKVDQCYDVANVKDTTVYDMV